MSFSYVNLFTTIYTKKICFIYLLEYSFISSFLSSNITTILNKCSVQILEISLFLIFCRVQIIKISNMKRIYTIQPFTIGRFQFLSNLIFFQDKLVGFFSNFRIKKIMFDLIFDGFYMTIYQEYNQGANKKIKRYNNIWYNPVK